MPPDLVLNGRVGGNEGPNGDTIFRMRATDLVMQDRRQYDGWLIVGVIFLATGLAIGTSNYAFGLFVEPLERSFGWQRTAISASLSFAAVGSITAPLIGRAMDRYGARPILAASLVLMGLSFLLRPLMTELWHWYFLSLLQFAPFAGITMLPAGRLVGIWFQEARGRAMGFAMMGNNFGGLTMPLIVGLLLTTASWQAAFVVVAAMAFLIAMLALLLVSEHPKHANTRTGVPLTPTTSETALTGWTVPQALRTRAFYAITLAMMLASFTYSTVLPHVSAHLANEGMTTTVVVRALVALAAFGMLGKLTFGYLADRFTARHAMMLSLGGQTVFILLMVVYPSSPQVWISVPLFGLCMGGYGTLTVLIIQDSFGLRHFGSISGLVNMSTVVPFALGPLLAGASYDLRESYGPAFVIVAAMFAIAIAMVTQVRRPRPQT